MTSFRLALRILRQTFLSLFRNWSSVLRAASLPLLLPIVVLFGWSYWAYTSGYALKYLPKHVGGGGQFPVFAVAIAVMVFLGSFPVAVAWHRFDLRGERPSLGWPSFGIGYSLGYLGRSLLLLPIAIILAIVLLLPFFLLAERGPEGFSFNLGALPEPATGRNFVLAAIYAALLSAPLLRLSLILPAGAVGRKLTLSEANAAAKSHLGFGVLLLLGLFMHLAPIALNALLAEMPLNQLGSILLVPFILLFWFMFGIALLTTLYGHCVEDRPLN